jgi:hypothetical protein
VVSRRNRNGGNWWVARRLAAALRLAAAMRLAAGLRRAAALMIGAIGLLISLPLASAPTAADGEAWRQFRGQVVISDVLLAPSFGSDRVMITSLNRMRRSVVAEVTGFWRLHLVAFLDPGAEGDVLMLAARDVTSAENRGAARTRTLDPVRVFEVPVQPAQRILHMNDLVLTRSMGFERGHDYEVTVEKNPDSGGKADVYARGVVTLR